MFRTHALWAVLKRNVLSYFWGVLGYLFIVVFVVAGALAAFNSQFFAHNLANLDQLSRWFPLLLLFLVPAITMSAWADERKLKTDELLFTLPAHDVEILLGKYLAVLAVYSAALLVSMTYLISLAWIGDPDWGQIATTYLGYWLAGGALLSAGLVGSALSSNTTVAFVLGAALCAVPVLPGYLPGDSLLYPFSLTAQLRDFTLGQVPLSGVLYFVSFTALMLYLNLVLIARRHWVASKQTAMWLQYAVRAVALAAILISLNVVAERVAAAFNTRLDLTSEQLFTLTPTTRNTIDRLATKEQPVTIQAFVSPDVPREFVNVRKQLVGLLNQYDRLGGKWIDVRLVDVAPNSEAAREARALGIEPRSHKAERDGRTVEQDVYLGVVVTSSRDEVVIPFFGDGMATEYELTRSLGTVLSKERLTVGILETDAHVHIHLVHPEARWIFGRIVAEMHKQYDLVQLKPEDLAKFTGDATAPETESDDEEQTAPDVLLVVQPSALTETQMGHLVKYVEDGYPVLVFDDPLPFYPFVHQSPQFGVVNAPRQERPSPGTPYAALSTAPQAPTPPIPQQLQQFPPQFLQQWLAENPEYQPRFEEKASAGRAARLLDALGIRWDNGAVVWDIFDPHPDFSPERPEWLEPDELKFHGPRENLYTFIAAENGNATAINPEDRITAGLQEIVAFYPGEIEEGDGTDLEFTPLLATGQNAGVLEWNDVTETITELVERPDPSTGAMLRERQPITSPYTGQPLRRVRPRPPREFSEESHVLAAHITAEKGADADINAVFVADIDLITDFAFETQEQLGRPLDNVALMFNAIEVLAGDASYVELRGRRPRPRTLTVWQETTDRYRRQRREAQREAEETVEEELTDARARLEKKTEQISSDEDLGILQKAQSLAFTAETEEERFRRTKRKLEQDLEETIEGLKAKEQRQISRYERRIKTLVVALPPVPAILLGLVVLGLRLNHERSDIRPERRA